MLDVIGGHGTVGAEAVRRRELYKAMEKAYKMPALLTTRNSYLNSTTSFMNVLFILQDRAQVNASYQPSPEPIQPKIDQNIEALRKLWQTLPPTKKV